jgi:hypothetical protein
MTKSELREQLETLRLARKAKLVKKYQELAQTEKARWEAANPRKAELMKTYAEEMVKVDHLNALMIGQCSNIIPGHRLCLAIDLPRKAWSFGEYPSNEELKDIAQDYKQEVHNIDHEFAKLEELISEVPANKAFKMLVAAGLPFTENKVANLMTLQPAQLNKSLII